MKNDVEYISDKEIITVNPHKNLTITLENVKEDFTQKYWNKEHVVQCINQINNHKHKMLLQFLWMSGIRITEALSLKKKDLDFQNYVMSVLWQKNKKYQRRIVPLHPQLRDLLQLYTATFNNDDRVFPISRQRGWQLTKKYLGGNPHKIRHSFAVNWLRSGADFVTLHRVLGHSDIQTTMEYLKIVPTDQGKELLKVSFT